MTIKKNDVYTVTCIDYNEMGYGLTKVDGFVFFIPGLIKDEVAKIKVLKVLKHYGFGKIESLVQPSPYRVDPPCGVYHKCGGCQLMHMDYPHQLAFKKHHVHQCFQNIAHLDVPINDVVENPSPFHYRNKVQLPLLYQNDHWTYGFYRPHSHDLINFDSCMIQHGFANAFLPKLMTALDQTQIKDGFKHVVLKMFEQDIMLVLVVKKDLDDGLIQPITDLVKTNGITSFYLNIHPDESNVVLSLDNRLVYGKTSIQASCLGLSYDISVNSFYQVNTKQMERLYSIAYGYASVNRDETILDLYCGTGTIGLGIAEKVKSLIGVDVVASSIDNAKSNALHNGITNAFFYCMDAGEAATYFVKQGIYFDCIFVDPPRKGCDGTTIDALVKLNPKRIVYISCNPSTLARDCALLKEYYTVEMVQPVDMFSQTYHCECVVKLKRKEKWIIESEWEK